MIGRQVRKTVPHKITRKISLNKKGDRETNATEFRMLLGSIAHQCNEERVELIRTEERRSRTKLKIARPYVKYNKMVH